jgi:hypothetical protein
MRRGRGYDIIVALLLLGVLLLGTSPTIMAQEPPSMAEGQKQAKRSIKRASKSKSRKNSKRVAKKLRRAKRPNPPAVVSPPTNTLPSESLEGSKALTSFIEGFSQELPGAEAEFAALAGLGRGGSVSQGLLGGRQGGTTVAAVDEAAPEKLDADEQLSRQERDQFMNDLPHNQELGHAARYIPASKNCSGRSATEIAAMVGAFCGPYEKASDLKDVIEGTVLADTPKNGCLAGIAIDGGELITSFFVKSQSRLARSGLERRDVYYRACKRPAVGVVVGPVGPGVLVLSRRQTTENRWNYSRGRIPPAGPRLIINTGTRNFSFSDVSFKDGKQASRNWVTGDIKIHPRKAGITPYAEQNCGRNPKPGCAYWQNVESDWKGESIGTCPDGTDATFLSFRDASTVSNPYISRATPHAEPSGEPWIISTAFVGKGYDCQKKQETRYSSIVEGIDPMKCTLPDGNMCNPVCSWIEWERTPGLVGFLHALHQTLPQIERLGIDLDADYRAAACAACGSVQNQPIAGPFVGKCIQG